MKLKRAGSQVTLPHVQAPCEKETQNHKVLPGIWQMLIMSAAHHGNKWREGNSGSRGYSIAIPAASEQMDKLLEKWTMVLDASSGKVMPACPTHYPEDPHRSYSC